MNQNLIRVLCALLVTGLFMACSIHADASQKKQETCREREFTELLQKKLGKTKILLEEGENVSNEALTNERAAYWLMRAAEKKGGEKSTKKAEQIIVEKKRLSDYKKISSPYREFAVKTYAMGIMPGTSNGLFSTNRAFYPKETVSKTNSRIYIKRLFQKETRKKLSPDGQLIRTLNLPKNYKKFDYILASYPNSYYEATFDYERYIDKKMVKGRDYDDPVDIKKGKLTLFNDETYPMTEIMDLYLDQWVDTVKRNMEARFNFDYRTSPKTPEWVNKLRKTYYLFGDDYDLRITRDIQKYVKRAVKNKVIVKGSVDIDRSSLYRSIGGFFIRTHVKFKIVSANNLEKQEDLFYSDSVYLKNLKRGKWMERYFDVGIGTSNGLSMGGDYAVVDDVLAEQMQ